MGAVPCLGQDRFGNHGDLAEVDIPLPEWTRGKLMVNTALKVQGSITSEEVDMHSPGLIKLHYLNNKHANKLNI